MRKNEAATLQIKNAEKNREWQKEGVPVLKMSVSLPTATQMPDARIRRFIRYYRSFARSYEQYCARFLLAEAAEDFRAKAEASRPFSPWEARVSFSVTFATPRLVSICTDAEEFHGGKRERLIRRTDTWNLLDGFPLRLSDFFPGEILYRRRILKRLRGEVASERARGVNFREDAKLRLRTAFNPENFYLTEEGLHVYYQMYALAGEDAGTPDFLLPWEKSPCIPPELA